MQPLRSRQVAPEVSLTQITAGCGAGRSKSILFVVIKHSLVRARVAWPIIGLFHASRCVGNGGAVGGLET